MTNPDLAVVFGVVDGFIGDLKVLQSREVFRQFALTDIPYVILLYDLFAKILHVSPAGRVLELPGVAPDIEPIKLVSFVGFLGRGKWEALAVVNGWVPEEQVFG